MERALELGQMEKDDVEFVVVGGRTALWRSLDSASVCVSRIGKCSWPSTWPCPSPLPSCS